MTDVGSGEREEKAERAGGTPAVLGRGAGTAVLCPYKGGMRRYQDWRGFLVAEVRR